jgi:hypothetical protein
MSCSYLHHLDGHRRHVGRAVQGVPPILQNFPNQPLKRKFSDQTFSRSLVLPDLPQSYCARPEPVMQAGAVRCCADLQHATYCHKLTFSSSAAAVPVLLVPVAPCHRTAASLSHPCSSSPHSLCVSCLVSWCGLLARCGWRNNNKAPRAMASGA